MRTMALMFLVTFATACASGGGTSTTASEPQPRRGSANLITEAEIAQGAYQTALEIVQSLRPAMMRARTGATSAASTGSPGLSESAATGGSVVVYVDESRLGEVPTLASIPAQRVKEIRYVNGRDATTRWGTGHANGVIQVIMRK